MEKERAELAAADEERQKKHREAMEKKRKADTERANALFETVSSLWDEQIDDEIWADEKNRAEQKKRLQTLIEKQPELSKDLFKIVHCASARYAEVLSTDAQRQRDLSSRLGHVMKRRKTTHVASARAAEAPAPTPSAPKKKTLMDIMSGYNGKGGSVSGTATSIMQRLYNSHLERHADPF